MTYIYDIVLNFHTNYYEYFEWDNTDILLHVRKIPLFRVKDIDLYNLKYNDLKINKEFINSIFNKVLYYNDSNKSNKEICFLVSNKKQAIGLLVDLDGNLLKRSSLLFDEEEEVNEEVVRLNNAKINYKLIGQLQIKKNSRVKDKRKDYIDKYVLKINSDILLQYLYYECYEKEEIEIPKIKDKLLNDYRDATINKLFTILKLINKNGIKQK